MRNLAETSTQRILGIDALRFLAFLAILSFHCSYLLWAPLGLERLPSPPLWLELIELYARLLWISGFVVLFLSFFLFGFSKNGWRKKDSLLLLLVVFAVAWTFSTSDFPYIWDIYPYLLVTVSGLVLVDRLKVPPLPMTIAGVILTSLPFWRLEGQWPVSMWLEQIFIGVCRGGRDLGEWPLLPWIGYPFFAFGLGRLAQRLRPRLHTINAREAGTWVLVLALSIPFLENYYVTRIGSHFGCSVFRKPPLEFWAHQMWLLFALRLSLTEVVQTWLRPRRWMQWLSRLQINRSFFLVYFLHYPLILAAAALGDHFALLLKPWFYLFTWISVLILSEVLAQLTSAIVSRRIYLQNEIKKVVAWVKVSGR